MDYIRTHTTLKRDEMCGLVFGLDCSRRITKNLNWTISIPEKNNAKRRSDENNNYEKDQSDNIENKRYSTVVQVTDIHVDPYYTAGTNAACGEPLCCRQSNGIASDNNKAAGVWGDYRNCDTPIVTLRHALKHISEKHPNVMLSLKLSEKTIFIY